MIQPSSSPGASSSLAFFQSVPVKTRRGGNRSHPGSTGFAAPRVAPPQPAPPQPAPAQPAPAPQQPPPAVQQDRFSDAALQAAIDAHLAGSISEAEAVYEQFVAARQLNTVAYTNLAAIRLNQAREPEAIALCGKPWSCGRTSRTPGLTWATPCCAASNMAKPAPVTNEPWP